MRQNFRPVHIQSISRFIRNLMLPEHLKSVHGRVGVLVGNGEKCWLPAFYPFPMFSKGFSLQVIQILDSDIKG